MSEFILMLDSSLHLPAEHKGEAYRVLCDLNKRDDLKTAGLIDSDNKSFAYMPADYPEVYKDAKEILEALGFELSEDVRGNIWFDGYSDKKGDMDIFLGTLQPLLRGMCAWENRSTGVTTVWNSNNPDLGLVI